MAVIIRGTIFNGAVVRDLEYDMTDPGEAEQHGINGFVHDGFLDLASQMFEPLRQEIEAYPYLTRITLAGHSLYVTCKSLLVRVCVRVGLFTRMVTSHQLTPQPPHIHTQRRRHGPSHLRPPAEPPSPSPRPRVYCLRGAQPRGPDLRRQLGRHAQPPAKARDVPGRRDQAPQGALRCVRVMWFQIECLQNHTCTAL